MKKKEQVIMKGNVAVYGHIAGVKPSESYPYGHKGSIASKSEIEEKNMRNGLSKLTFSEKEDLWFSETLKKIKEVDIYMNCMTLKELL